MTDSVHFTRYSEGVKVHCADFKILHYDINIYCGKILPRYKRLTCTPKRALVETDSLRMVNAACAAIS